MVRCDGAPPTPSKIDVVKENHLNFEGVFFGLMCPSEQKINRDERCQDERMKGVRYL
jgi:hypothetical protein